mgnify:FL=1
MKLTRRRIRKRTSRVKRQKLVRKTKNRRKSFRKKRTKGRRRRRSRRGGAAEDEEEEDNYDFYGKGAPGDSAAVSEFRKTIINAQDQIPKGPNHRKHSSCEIRKILDDYNENNPVVNTPAWNYVQRLLELNDKQPWEQPRWWQRN